MLVDVQRTSGCRSARVTDDRQQDLADGRGERRHPYGPGWRRGRVEVQAGGLEGGEDRDGVSRQPLARPGSAAPAARAAPTSGVPASRARAAICCETVEVVTCIVSPTSRMEPRRDSSSSSSRRRGSTLDHSRLVNGISINLTWTWTIPVACTGDHGQHRGGTPHLSPYRHLMALGSMTLYPARPASVRRLFGEVGAPGAVWLRLAWAAVILLAVVRPRPGASARRSLLTTIALGIVTAGLTMLFMAAVARLPLGTASALEFLGPPAWLSPAAAAAERCCGRVSPRPGCCC